jgi:hypothetical protein
MKLFSYILSFYLLLLPAIPCCVADNCADEKTEKKTSLTKNSNEPSDDCGNCSPFFSCSCCAIATIAYELQQPGIATINIPAVYAVYMELPLPEVNYNFWQPPKIG